MNANLTKLVQSVSIETPCSVGWDTMEGDERVRFCGQCKLNVHNLSDMSEKEAGNFLVNNKDRTCVFLYRRADGTVVTDNCPKGLREVRNRVTSYAFSALVILSIAWATGILSPPTMESFSFITRTGEVADYGYDTARDVSRLVTAVSFWISFFMPMNKRTEANLSRVSIDLVALALVPLLVHLSGTFYVNSFGGGLGGL